MFGEAVLSYRQDGEAIAATGDTAYQIALTSWLPISKLTQTNSNPAYGDIRDFGFKRVAEGWGCALRTFAFAHRSKFPVAR